MGGGRGAIKTPSTDDLYRFLKISGHSATASTSSNKSDPNDGSFLARSTTPASLKSTPLALKNEHVLGPTAGLTELRRNRRKSKRFSLQHKYFYEFVEK